MTLKKAIYPGTFDPPTYGHLDVIKRASAIFDKVIVAVNEGSRKNVWFTGKERIKMLKDITVGLDNVVVDSFNELLVDYVKRKNVNVVVRGLRALSDFEYEFQMALTNRGLAPTIETVFLMPSENYSYLSSSLIKEISALGGSVKKFVPSVIEKQLKKK